MDNNLSEKIAGATKWSIITEIMAKLIAPITNMILARLLVPEVFGVVATVTMVISFADIFSDAGFQKYLVQFNFKSQEELDNSTAVAFWANLIVSLILWILISFFSENIADLVGNSGKGLVISVSCMSLPLTSFSSIQIARLRRDFDFKTLFLTRIIGILVPFLVTIPLAFILRNYWALIIGTICGNLANAIVLTVKSLWKPNFFFKFDLLKQMISFSIWTLAESVITWLTSYIDVFIIGRVLTAYYIGIYKTSMTTVNQIMALVTGATTTVLFSALSRLQDNDKEFQNVFYTFQRSVGTLVIPMGVGIFIYKDIITGLLLGNQWTEAEGFIGIWGLVGGIYIVLGSFCSEAYRAKGMPRLSFLAQLLYITMLVPILLFTVNTSFKLLYISRAMTRILFIIIHLIFMHKVIKISPKKMLINIFPYILAAFFMGVFAFFLRQFSDNIIYSFTTILISIIIYFFILLFFPNVRSELILFFHKRLKSKK